MRLIKIVIFTLIIIFFAGLYWGGAVKQLKFVNTDMSKTDQSAYMNYAKQMVRSDYTFVGGRNRMPIYPFIQSLFYRSGMSEEAFFTTGKYVNVILSMILLILIGFILRKFFHWLHALVLCLIFSFTVFIFKAGYFQAELLFYFLNLCLFLLMYKLILAPSWSLAILTGLVAGLAHLTKASILPGFLIFLFVASLKSGWVFYKNWHLKPKVVEWKQMRLNLFVVPLVGLFFLVTVFPYIQTSKRVFGSYFYNVNSTFYLWYDSWQEVELGTKAHGDRIGWPDMPAEKIPSMSHYLQDHTLHEISLRFLKGADEVIVNVVNSYGYFTYFIIFLIFLIFATIFDWIKHKNIPKVDPSILIFLSAYFVLYFLLYSWYVPIASGNRFILAQFMPAMFVISIGLQEMIQMEKVKLFTRKFSGLFVIDVLVLIVMMVDIHLILTSRIIHMYGGS
jgi:hypothetical protein